MLKVNSITDMVREIANAMQLRSIDRLDELDSINDDWMQTIEERTATKFMIDTAREFLYLLDY